MGFMGITHLGALSKIPNIELAAIYSNNPRILAGDLSHAASGNLNRPPVDVDISSVRKYTVLQEMVEDPSLDAIDICLPTDLHASTTIAALEAGKHVLCEKPMAASQAECERMIAAAENAGRVLMIAHVLRFWPEYEFLLDFVRSKRYGAVRSATFTRRCGIPDWSTWLTNDDVSGGAVLDLLIHDIDQIVLLFGMPDRVAAKKIVDPDTLSATFIYPDPIEVRLQGGWFAAGLPFSMGFQVRAERALVDWTAGALALSDHNGNRIPVDLPAHDAYESELEYFAASCRTDARPERCPPEQSAQAVELALLLKESRAQGGAQLKCSV